MDILQINTLDKKGGAARVAYTLKNSLEKMGHKTSMFVRKKYSDDKNVYLIKKQGVFIKFLSKITGRNLQESLRRRLSHLFANDIDIFQSDQILETSQFKNTDIIHCHNLHSYYFNLNTLIKISTLKPVIWTFHDMWPITPHCAHSFDEKVKDGFFECPSLNTYPPILWHNERYLRKTKRKIYENSKFNIVVPSKWLKNKISQTVLKNKSISVIYNGIDIKKFKPTPQDRARGELNLPRNKKIIMFIAKGGPNNPWKGWDYFQEVKNKLRGEKDYFFLVVGHNDKDKQNIKYLGFINNDRLMAQYYSACDLLLYPSLADNCPLAVIEAQACGLPVAAFETGGIPEIIKHKETGFIARYKDVDHIIQGINFILNLGPSESNNFRSASLENVLQNFTLEKMTEEYVKLYKSGIENFTFPHDYKSG